jgi:hypothetical protein
MTSQMRYNIEILLKILSILREKLPEKALFTKKKSFSPG